MDALTIVMILAVVVAVGVYFHRSYRRSQSPADLPPGTLTVGAFYEQNPLRRSSDEVDLGDGWSDASDSTCTYSVFWIEDTGEVYALRVPRSGVTVMDGAGDFGFTGNAFAPTTVVVLGRAATRDELDRRLGESPTMVNDSDGVGWIKRQLNQP